MANDRVMITATNKYPDYTVTYVNATVTYADVSAEAKTLWGTPVPFLQAAADYVYFGWTAKTYMLGFRYETAGDLGAITCEYWNGGAWVAFTPYHDSTEVFSKHGYAAWGLLASWATTNMGAALPATVYWIRCKVASVTIAPEFYHMMLNLDMEGPLVLDPQYGVEQLYPDINGTVRKADLVYYGPTHASLDATNIAAEMDNLNLLWYFRDGGGTGAVYLNIYEYAQSLTKDPDIDAYFVDYYGYIQTMPGRAMSPQKMDAETYTIDFKIQSVTTLFTAT